MAKFSSKVNVQPSMASDRQPFFQTAVRRAVENTRQAKDSNIR